MNAVRTWTPRADGGLLLASLVVAASIIVAWPGRPDVANASWDVVAPIRTIAFAVWGWALGIDLATRERAPDRAPDRATSDGGLRAAVARLAAAGAVTAGIEAVAHAAQVPPAPFAWNAFVAPAIAIGGCGVAFATVRTLVRAGVGWAALLAVPVVAAGLIGLDFWTGVPMFAPWLLPAAPSPLAAVAVFVPAVVTVAAAARVGGRS